MRLISLIASVAIWVTGTHGTLQYGVKAPLAESRMPKNAQVSTVGTVTLDALAGTQYAALYHPAFPRHQVRIKRSHFCDNTVRYESLLLRKCRYIIVGVSLTALLHVSFVQVVHRVHRH